jgi:hypothetical protein
VFDEYKRLETIAEVCEKGLHEGLGKAAKNHKQLQKLIKAYENSQLKFDNVSNNCRETTS